MAKGTKKGKLLHLTQDRILRKSRILVVLDAPLQVEMQTQKAFSAPSLKTGLFYPMNTAGISRRDVQLTYLANFAIDFPALFYTKDSETVQDFVQMPNHKEVYIRNFFMSALKRLKAEIALVQPSTIVVAGKWSLMLLTAVTDYKETTRSRFGTLLKWRGSHLKLIPFFEYSNPHLVIPVLPPASHFILGEARIYSRADYARVNYTSLEPEKYLEPNWDIKVPTKCHEALEIFYEIKQTLDARVCKVSVDIETERAYMDCLAFTIDGIHAITIVLEGETKPRWTFEEELELTEAMIAILLHPNTRLTGQNFSYDMQYFHRFWGISVKPAYDTIIMQHVLNPALKKDLATLSSLYCGYHKYWKEEGKLGAGATREERYIYNGKDVNVTWEVATLLDQVYEERRSMKAPLDFQTHKLLPVVTKMMYRGVKVDLKRRYESTQHVESILNQLENLLEYIGLGGINFNSPKQLQDLFYKTLGASVQYSPLTGKITTGKAALKAIKEENILYKPIVELVELFRSYSVLLRTFLKARLDEDKRLRCFYKVTGTDTFRLASTKNAFGTGLNLQNIPPEKTLAFDMKLPSIKKLIIPDNGMEIYDADLGSADARIVWGETGSKIMGEIFESGEDLYATLASEYYHRPIHYKENPTDKKIRQLFKSVAHATHYIGTSKGIAARLGLLVHEVDIMQKWYFSMNPELKAWHGRIKGWVDLRGYIENVFGFRYYFINKRPTVYQQAAAWQAQSAIAVLINKVLVACEEDEILQKLMHEVLLQVHDSFVGQYDALRREEAKARILKHFEIPLHFPAVDLIIPADMKTSTRSWGHCK